MILDTKDRTLDDTLDELNAKNSNIDWVILTHVKTTYKIKVHSKGKGFTNMKDELEPGLIQYIIIRYLINNIAKGVFITWCGDSVQGPFKGKLNLFIKDMEYFLKGRYHLVVMASTEEDIKEKEIKIALEKGAGSNYDATLKLEQKKIKKL